jgi:superoxide reductase
MSDSPALSGMNRVEDIENAGDFEKKHTPFITAEKTGDRTKVTVKVGHWVSHPNQPDHFIQWIEVYANDLPMARFDLTAVAVDPEVSCVLNVDAGTVVSAVESCNLHGLWAAAITV